MPTTSKSSDFLELLQSAKRGRLKVYIGSVAGVGKTYRMLEEAHSLKEKGIDVVVGFIETHGRKETDELVPGLELVPRMKHQYRDVFVEEMDLDAILNRKPEVVIVDELAHTNLPICRNEKRYQDVIELLLSGINVICAFNIQHLESLNDVVESATSVKVHETVPDTFLKRADQVVNIDLAAEDLIDRLKAGKIYKKEKIEQALQNFFKLDNLGQLRELALREVAERIEKPTEANDIDKDSLRSASDKLMVCLKPEIYSQKYLLRKASRLAGKLNTDWFVVYVETSRDQPEIIDSQKQRNLYTDIQLAQELGAKFVHLKNVSRLNGWIKFADSERIKHFVLSGQNEKWWDIVIGKSLIQNLLKLEKYDLHLVSPKPQTILTENETIK
jgi:two-component system, OmpR family, sensor histidine kinase KdpD